MAWDMGKCIRDERLARGWTQGELGQRAGYTQKAISKIELGRQRGVTKVVEVARALGLNPYYVRTGKGPKKAGPQIADMAKLCDAIALLDPEKQRTIRAYMDVQMPGWDDNGPVLDIDIPKEGK
jgi:transcriptional regulator with XRE-family HTH domain